MAFPAAGIGSNVWVGSNQVANIDNWTVTPKGLGKDTTSFGASGSWQQNTSTIKEWSVKWDGRMDPSDANGQLVILQNINNTYTIKMYVDNVWYWTGTALNQGGQFKSSANDVVLATYNWLGTGPLTLTNV